VPNAFGDFSLRKVISLIEESYLGFILGLLAQGTHCEGVASFFVQYLPGGIDLPVLYPSAPGWHNAAVTCQTKNLCQPQPKGDS
jgi:hypothetical protein